jgi:heat shock protein HtpX
MTEPNSALFFFLSWIVIGPPLPLTLALVFVAFGVMSVLLLRHQFHSKTIALLCMLGIMFAQSLQLMLMGLHLEGVRPYPPPHMETAQDIWGIFSTLFRFDSRLAQIGVLAAACVALYIEFGRSRLDMAKAFPTLQFLDPPAQLVQSVKKLAGNAGMESPEIRLVDSGVPSAFTVRVSRKYVIAVSVGLLESFDDDEVEACIAHEISHLKNNDFTVRSIATLGKIALFARPLSYLIESAIYRAREFLADRTAAVLIGGPRALISALTKLQESSSMNLTGIQPTFSCCFDGRKSFFGILNKHPDLATRIRVLREMKLS